AAQPGCARLQRTRPAYRLAAGAAPRALVRRQQPAARTARRVRPGGDAQPRRTLAVRTADMEPLKRSLLALACACAAMAAVAAPPESNSEPPRHEASELELKAVYLLKFGDFVQWPAT